MVGTSVSFAADEIGLLPSISQFSSSGQSGSLQVPLVIFKHVSRIDILSTSYEIALRWMPQDRTGD